LRRPAVGLGHRRVDLLVELPQHRDKPLLVNLAVLVVERRAGAQLLQHVVHLRQRQPRMRRLPLLAESIQPLAELADARAQGFGWIGEGEGVEAAGLVVAWIVTDAEATSCREGPGYMQLAR